MRPPDSDLALLFDRSPIGMYRATHDGTFLHVNPALARMLGYSVDELMTKNVARDLAVGKTTLWRCKDGRELEVKIWTRTVDDVSAQVDALVVDVQELAAATAQLQRTTLTLDMVMHLVPGIYWRIDRDQRVVEVGGAMQEVLGYSGRGRYVGKTLAEQHEREPSSIDSTEYHRRAIAGEVASFDSEYKGKHLASTVGPVRDGDGNIVGAIGIALDVTRSRLLERRMIDAQRAESLGVLAGGLAHDFNNLLVAVIGSADLALREMSATAPGRGAIENIRTAGLRAAELTEQLLAYAGRGGAGTKRVEPAPLVEELGRILAPTIPDGVRVTIDIPAELALRGDPAQVRQVLLNLLTNARDAVGTAGTIAITAREVEHATEPDDNTVLAAPHGRYVSIGVHDDGPGLSLETRGRVFEPFFTTKQTGHGLGLAATLGIVRAHGGGIRVVSRPGEGARFEILWPVATERARTSGQQPAAHARTVLVVDDEDLVRDVVARMIEDLGYATLTARDGATALELVARAPVDAVLLDLSMPHMNGAEVVAALRERHPALPVVLCSGYDRDGRGPVAADAYLPKPFRIEALERTLAKLLP